MPLVSLPASLEMASGGLRRPVGKVLELADGLFLPSLVWEHRRLNLGSHASKEVAEACYDAAKLLVRVAARTLLLPSPFAACCCMGHW